jgi:ABC transport system ATP-binding/permease protein
VVVSHDRYFVERVCDDVYALMGDGGLRHLPGGIEQYLELRRAAEADLEARQVAAATAAAPEPGRTRLSGGEQREARKELARVERALERLGAREAQLHEDMAAAATDPGRLRALGEELRAVTAERDDLEAAWLETSEALEG